MTVYLATASNGGSIDKKAWNSNVNTIQDAFNASAKVETWWRASDNVWLVKTSEDMTARELRQIITAANRYNKNSSDFVVSLGAGTNYDGYLFDPQATANWLAACLPKKQAVVPPIKKPPYRWGGS